MTRFTHKLMLQRGGQLQFTNHAKKLPSRSVAFVSKIIQLVADWAHKSIPSAQVIACVPEGYKDTLCLEPPV